MVGGPARGNTGEVGVLVCEDVNEWPRNDGADLEGIQEEAKLLGPVQVHARRVVK